MNVKGKVVIVTGASAGIGLATARLLAIKGAKVALVARSGDKLKKIAAEIPEAFFYVADLIEAGAVKATIEAVLTHYGRIDALINNAGLGIHGTVEKASIADYRKVLELNVIVPFLFMQAVIPIMRRQGGGTILNISSMLSKTNLPVLGVYASTKSALNTLSLTARTELKRDNIIVSIMYPGLTATDFRDNALKSADAVEQMKFWNSGEMPIPDTPEYVAERILVALKTGAAETFAHDKNKSEA